MFVTPAYAQAAGGGGSELLVSILPFVAIFAIMYFLLIRPQRQQMKKREEMLNNIRRNDMVVTGGGLIGKVVKAADTELEVEIASGVKVKALRSMIAEVRVKGEPVSDGSADKKAKKEK
ncbi:MAG: preprotein translocase subunit YajC [Pseudomonadota bacterium]